MHYNTIAHFVRKRSQARIFGGLLEAFHIVSRRNDLSLQEPSQSNLQELQQADIEQMKVNDCLTAGTSRPHCQDCGPEIAKTSNPAMRLAEYAFIGFTKFERDFLIRNRPFGSVQRQSNAGRNKMLTQLPIIVLHATVCTDRLDHTNADFTHMDPYPTERRISSKCGRIFRSTTGRSTAGGCRTMRPAYSRTARSSFS